MALTAAELKVIVEAVGTDKAKAAVAGLGTEVDKTAGKSSRAGAVQAAAGKAIVGATAAVGASYAASITVAADFQQQLANINTVARLSESDTGRLGDAIQQMSRDTGISTTELTQSMYDLVSAGTITSEDLRTNLAGSMDVVRNAANLAIGGMGDLAGTTDVLTSALNAYGLDASHAGEVTDAMAVAIERGKVTADEIGASIANVAPIASAAGISLQEIAATYATLTANGVPAAEATTQMRAAIVALQSPNEALQRIMAATGKNYAEIADTKGLTVALSELRADTEKSGDVMTGFAEDLNKIDFTKPGTQTKEVEKVMAGWRDTLGLTRTEAQHFVDDVGKEGMGEALQNLKRELGSGQAGLSDALGRVEAFNFTLQTTGDNAAEFGDNYKAAMDATGTASEQAAIAMEGPGETAKRLVANITTFMQDVGGPAAQTLGPFLLAMNQLGPAMMLPIKLGTALGGVIGGLAGKAAIAGGSIVKKLLPSLSEGLGPALKGLGPKLAGGLGGALKGVIPALGGAVSGMMSGLVGLIGAAMPILAAAWPILLIGAIVAGLALLLSNEDIRNAVFGFIGSVLKWIGDALSGLASFIGNIFGTALSAAATIVGKYFEIMTAPIRFFIGVVASIWNGVAEHFGAVLGAIGTIVKTAFDIITAPIRIFINFIAGIWNGVTEKAGAVWDAITGVIRGAVGVITGIIQGIVAIAQGVWNTVSGIFGAIGDAAKTAGDVVGNVGGAIHDAPGNVWDWVTHLDTGAWEIPSDMLAVVHKGEMIVPANSADPMRRFLKSSNDQRDFRTGQQSGTARYGGGDSTVIEHLEVNVPVTGLLRAEQPKDIAEIMRRAAASGYIIPRKPRLKSI